MLLEMVGFLLLLFVYFVVISIILLIPYGLFLICFEIYWFFDERKRMKKIKAMIADLEDL